MSDVDNDPCAVTATVIRGGNRLLRIVAHVVCRDANGQVRWEDDAVTEFSIPAGTEIPEFQCEDVRSVVVPNSRSD